MTDPKAFGRALVACVSDRSAEERRAALAPFRGDDLGRLAFHALHHRVVPFLYLGLRASGLEVDAEALASLQRTYAVRAGEHLRALADLDAFREALARTAVGFMVVKGPALAERLYPSPDLRAYDDLDLLVPPSSFGDVIDAMEAAGFSLLDRNWELIRQERRGQLHLRLTNGTLADVHWHLLNREIVRDAFELPVEDLFDRGREVDIGGRATRTLDPADTLLHLCMHASLSGGDRLLWLKDIEQAIVVDRPSWSDVVERARAWRAGPSVAIALARARRTLGTPVPDDVLRALAGRPRLWIGAWVDRVWPVETSTGRVTPAVLWAQVARGSWGATLHALVGRAERRSRSLMREREGGHGQAPIFQATGGDADERAYLRDVSGDPPA